MAKPVPTERSYGRKPYIKGEVGDYREMMDTTTRQSMLDKRLEKKSVLDKPYLQDIDYPAMEYQQSPQRPSLSNLDLDTPESRYAETVEDELGPEILCAVNFIAPHKCEDPLKCYFAAYSTFKLEEYVRNMEFFLIRDGVRSRIGTDGIQVRWKEFPYPMIYILPLEAAWHFWPEDKKDVVEVHVYNIYKGRKVHRCEAKTDVFCRREACCGNPPEGTFTFDDASTSDTIAAGGSTVIYVTGGCAPFTFATATSGYTFNGGVASYETTVRNATLTSSECCETDNCAFTVTDKCGTVVSGTITIVPTTAMTYDNATSDDTVARSSHCHIFVVNGCAPYDYSVSGTGFTWNSTGTTTITDSANLTEQLDASGTACGTATITVTDACGTVVTGYVRCTTGSWAPAAPGTLICGFGGGNYSIADPVGKFWYRVGFGTGATNNCTTGNSCIVSVLANAAAYGFPSALGCNIYCQSNLIRTTWSGDCALDQNITGDPALYRQTWGC